MLNKLLLVIILLLFPCVVFAQGVNEPSPGMHADWIAIGTVDNVVQIKSIDYKTNTITLMKPMTWKAGDKIWLYRKSDGKRVLYGPAPDMGAHEFVGKPAQPKWRKE